MPRPDAQTRRLILTVGVFLLLAWLGAASGGVYWALVAMLVVSFALWSQLWRQSDILDWQGQAMTTALGLFTAGAVAVHAGVTFPRHDQVEVMTQPGDYIASLPAGVLQSSDGGHGMLLAMAVAVIMVAGRRAGPVGFGLAGAVLASAFARSALRGVDEAFRSRVYTTIEEATRTMDLAWCLVPALAIVGEWSRRRQEQAALRSRALALQASRRRDWVSRHQAATDSAPSESEDTGLDDDGLSASKRREGDVVAAGGEGRSEDIEEIETSLFGSAIFSDLTEEHLHEVASLLTLEHFGPGEMLFEEGDQQVCLFIIKRGVVSIRKSVSERGETARITDLYAGAVIGEMALVDGQARSASALAVDDVSVIRVDAEVMDHLFATRPHVGVKIKEFLLETVANRLQASSHAMFGEAEVDVEAQGRGGRAQGEMDEVKKRCSPS